MSNTELINKFTKNHVYKKEQESVFNEIIKILGLIPDDNVIVLYKEDINTKSDEILALLDKIKVYYSASMWSNIERSDNKMMSIIRHILRHHKHQLKYKYVNTIRDGKKVSIQQYFIISLK